MTISLYTRVLSLVALAIVANLAANVLQLASLRTALTEGRQQAVVYQVDAAASVVQVYASAVAAGRMTDEEARSQAKAILRAIRYGQGNYIFGYDLDGVSVFHGLQPENEGKNMIGNKDPDGILTTVSLIAAAKRGGDFVSYSFARPGNPDPAPKISYARLVEPWGWVIGSGVYVDDLNAVFWQHVRSSLLWAGGLLAVLLACAVPLARSIVRPLIGLTSAMRRLSRGELDVAVPARGRGDEIGQMAEAVDLFKMAAVEKRRLEADAQTAGRLTEEERASAASVLADASERQTRVVELLGKGLSHLSQGDVAHRIEAPFPAEYEKLRADFNRAMAQLQGTMRTVFGSASAVMSGSGEIATASDDLSRRTEQQAASLEETAAALNEITATVRRTAESARHARTVVGNTRGDAEQSGRVVHQAVEAMSGIEKSSREITQIIGVIDEIAFQTNLLALNAGVEAARAGDAGRGFAVVASEVRALAQRSAEAAKEIKGLISESSVQVAHGVAYVGQTGQALAAIMAQVAEFDGIVGEIATSAQEQATGLDEVNSAVNQMDQVTQQNAAMVEESTAASHALSDQARKMMEIIGGFRLGGGEDGTGRPTSGPVRAAAPVQLAPAEHRVSSRPALPAAGSPYGTGATTVAALRTLGRSGAAPRPSPAADEWADF